MVLTICPWLSPLVPHDAPWSIHCLSGIAVQGRVRAEGSFLQFTDPFLETYEPSPISPIVVLSPTHEIMRSPFLHPFDNLALSDIS